MCGILLQKHTIHIRSFYTFPHLTKPQLHSTGCLSQKLGCILDPLLFLIPSANSLGLLMIEPLLKPQFRRVMIKVSVCPWGWVAEACWKWRWEGSEQVLARAPPRLLSSSRVLTTVEVKGLCSRVTAGLSEGVSFYCTANRKSLTHFSSRDFMIRNKYWIYHLLLDEDT